MIKSKASWLRSLAVFGLVLMLPGSVQVNAMSPEQRRLIDSNVFYFNSESDFASCGAGGNSNLVGSDNAEMTWNFFIEKGLTPIQAAGIMGNLSVESGFQPDNQENSVAWPNGGWGIAQWTGGRRDTLREAVLAAGLPYTNELTPPDKIVPLLAFELDFLYNESNQRKMRDDSNTIEWVGLTRVMTIEEAVIYWEYNFERAGIPALGTRLEHAQDILARYGSGTSSTTSSGAVTCSGGGGQLVNGYSLPVDKEFYDENPEWFTKPHHDYPAADIPVPEGTAIYAVRGGTVRSSGGDCGNGVTIAGDDGVTYTYCHGSDGGSVPGALDGDTVSAGQLIMHSSYTGHVVPAGPAGSHLHLAMSLSGTKLCPQTLFSGIATGSVPNVNDLPTSGCTYVANI